MTVDNLVEYETRKKEILAKLKALEQERATKAAKIILYFKEPIQNKVRGGYAKTTTVPAKMIYIRDYDCSSFYYLPTCAKRYYSSFNMEEFINKFEFACVESDVKAIKMALKDFSKMDINQLQREGYL